MSLDFPRFNTVVEENSVEMADPDRREVSINELRESVLAEFCPISRGMPPLVSSLEDGRKSKKISRINLEEGRCSSECQQ